MNRMRRRDFLTTTAGLLAAATVLPEAVPAAETPLTATTVRTLGKTGLKCTLLGIGTGTRGQGPGITDQTQLPEGELVKLLEYAYERGITFFDLADRYGSHPFMNQALKNSIPREKVMLLTKVWEREPETVRADIERFRKEIGTEVLDVVLMHCLRGGEDNWPDQYKATRDVLSEAKARGQIRALGVSCHTFASLKQVPVTDWADVVLVRINPFNSHMDGPVEEVVPVIQAIHDAGKGVLGMKILGEGDPNVVAKMSDSLEFVLGLGTVDAMTIGFMNRGELDGMVECINAASGARRRAGVSRPRPFAAVSTGRGCTAVFDALRQAVTLPARRAVRAASGFLRMAERSHSLRAVIQRVSGLRHRGRPRGRSESAQDCSCSWAWVRMTPRTMRVFWRTRSWGCAVSRMPKANSTSRSSTWAGGPRHFAVHAVWRLPEGRRPSFSDAARRTRDPTLRSGRSTSRSAGLPVETGEFGAHERAPGERRSGDALARYEEGILTPPALEEITCASPWQERDRSESRC